MHVSGREKLLLNVVFYHFLGGVGQKGESIGVEDNTSLARKEKERAAQLVVRKMYICRRKRGSIAIFFPSWFVLSMVNFSPLLE